MEAYLQRHQLPNEWDYFDPAKADEKRECGLHADWGRKAMGARPEPADAPSID
jgi:phosphoadenosine phosphosulfate reductase